MLNQLRLAVILLTLPALMTACLSDPPQATFFADGRLTPPPDMTDGQDSNVPVRDTGNANPGDAGPDQPVACGGETCAVGEVCIDNMRCGCMNNDDCQSIDRARCDTINNVCVPCTMDDHCRHLDLAVCVNERCAECNKSSDCLDLKASRCDTTTYTCTTCNSNRDCPDGKDVCNPDGECVECYTTPETEYCPDPNGEGFRVCDDNDGVCTDRLKGKVERCNPCQFSEECKNANDDCVERDLPLNDGSGGMIQEKVCLPRRPDDLMSCPTYAADVNGEQGYDFDLVDEDADRAVYCAPFGSCVALLRTINLTPCPTVGEPDPEFCGVTGVNDAECIDRDAGGDPIDPMCAMTCSSAATDASCPGNFSCDGVNNVCRPP